MQSIAGDGEHHLSVDCAVRMTAGEFECIAENAMGVITTKTTLVIGEISLNQLSKCINLFSINELIKKLI